MRGLLVSRIRATGRITDHRMRGEVAASLSRCVRHAQHAPLSRFYRRASLNLYECEVMPSKQPGTQLPGPWPHPNVDTLQGVPTEKLGPFNH